jgi:ABC-type branched-subunit amino acid transport system ATPase component
MTAPVPAPGSAAATRQPAEDAGLAVRDLSVTYSNGAIGVNGASVDVRPGEIVAVLGRNGAGKTSLLTGIAGFLRSERVSVSGSVRVAGTEVRGASPMRANRSGVVLVPERDKIFPSLTVSENLELVRPKRPDGRFDLAARFPALKQRATSRAGMLSGGERQMLALAMAVSQRPRVLLVDELSLGLAPVVVKNLLSGLREMAEAMGLAVLIVEQDAAAAMRVADYLYVLDRGEIAWNGEARATSAAELGRRYLGLPA